MSKAFDGIPEDLRESNYESGHFPPGTEDGWASTEALQWNIKGLYTRNQSNSGSRWLNRPEYLLYTPDDLSWIPKPHGGKTAWSPS